MIRCGWLADPVLNNGGAEMAAAELREAAPEGVEVIDCPPGNVAKDCDVWVAHNVVLYSPDELAVKGPAFKMWHDVGPQITPAQHEALSHATPICVSPLQREHMGLDKAELIPSCPPLEPFRKAAENAGERSGAVAIGPWMAPFKGADMAAEWARGNGGIDFYGDGWFAPPGAKPPVPHEDLPEILARYKTYVHLPREIEPFGRSTVEAWACGLEIVVNRLVGSRWWITEAPEKLKTAAEDFWRLVLDG